MSYKLSEFAPDSKFSCALRFDLLQQIVPLERIKAVLCQHHSTEKHERKLNMIVIIWVLIAMNLYTDCSLGEVLRKLAHGLRYIWPDPDYQLRGDNSITYRRE